MFYTKEGNLDWALALERNSEALKGIIAALFAMLGLDGEARWGGFRVQSTVPCCASSGRPNPPCGA